jgi:ribosome maturation factor RimP
VKVVTQTPCAGRSRFQGRLEGIGDGLLRVNCAGDTVAIHLENIKKANLVAHW